MSRARKPNTEGECVDALLKAAKVLGHSPTRPEYKELDISPSASTIQKHLGGWNKGKKKAGLKQHARWKKKSVNSDYFETVNNEVAYWLGFLYGDGCMCYDNRDETHTLRLLLSADDEEHVEKFRRDLDSKHTINIREIDGRHRAAIRIGDKKLTADLRELGLTPDKTFSNSLPELTKDSHKSSFVRGLFDADGHFDSRDGFTIISGSKGRLKALSEWYPDSVSTSLYEKHDTAYHLRVGKTQGAERFASWIYPSGCETTPALDRKLKKIPEKWIQKK